MLPSNRLQIFGRFSVIILYVYAIAGMNSSGQGSDKVQKLRKLNNA